MKKVFEMLLGRRAALLYLAVFAIAVGAATFVENDFGTDTAQKVVYRATWFETLLFLFGGSLVYNIIQFKLIQRRRWTVLIFHGAMLVILLGWPSLDFTVLKAPCTSVKRIRRITF